MPRRKQRHHPRAERPQLDVRRRSPKPPQRMRAAASKLKLKDPKDWKLLGNAAARLDIADKVHRQADLRHRRARCPTCSTPRSSNARCSGTLKSVDEASFAGMKGVRQVVALAGCGRGRCRQLVAGEEGRRCAAGDLGRGGNGQVSSASIARLPARRARRAGGAGVGRKDGDVDAALATAAKRVEAEYEVPFLATRRWSRRTARPTSRPTRSRSGCRPRRRSGARHRGRGRRAAAGKVVVHKTMLGGGFGRRGAVQDYVRQAVLIAKAVGQPVQARLVARGGHPARLLPAAAMARLRGGLDADGMPVAWQVRVCGPVDPASLPPSWLPGASTSTSLQGFIEDMPYDVPNYLGRLRDAQHACAGRRLALASTIRRTASSRKASSTRWRTPPARIPIGTAASCFAAQARGISPCSTRPRNGRAGAPPLPPGVFRGIALDEAFGSICAAGRRGLDRRQRRGARAPRGLRAIDSGHVVNPLRSKCRPRAPSSMG